MTLGRHYYDYICLSRSGSQTAEHFLSKQCTVCAAFTDVDANAFFPEGCLVSYILPTLSISCHQQYRNQTRHSYMKMTNFGKASNARSMFTGLKNFFDQSGLAGQFSPGNGLK